MRKLFYIILSVLAFVTTVSKGQSGETIKTEIKKTDSTMKKQILIDKFFVPGNSIEEFSQRMNYNRSFIKNLSGFIKEEVYQQIDEERNLTIITVAIWKDQESLSNAKNAVQAEYKRIDFNPADFYQRLNIIMERGIYNEWIE